MSSKYKMGDRVHKGGLQGTVRTHPLLNDDGTWRYLVDWDNEWVLADWCNEAELAPLGRPREDWGPKCECGAAFSSFPDHHSTWCPKFRPQYFSNDDD